MLRSHPNALVFAVALGAPAAFGQSSPMLSACR